MANIIIYLIEKKYSSPEISKIEIVDSNNNKMEVTAVSIQDGSYELDYEIDDNFSIPIEYVKEK